MAENLSYSQQRAQKITLRIRELLRELPMVCVDYMRAIEPATQPLTRFAYARDLKQFCFYLHSEVARFADRTPDTWTCEDLSAITARDISMFLDFLTLYYKDDAAFTNAELSKMRKLSCLRSFFHYLFTHSLINADITQLVDMPKRHEKPILRLEVDEVARMLDLVESGEALPEHQRNYNAHTRTRDLAILTLFLGTGIRVSELVGIDIEDVDFELGGFLVTRKGGDQAILYFSEEVGSVLEAYMAQRRQIEALPGHEQALFLSLQRKRMGVRAVELMVKKYAMQAAPLKKRLSPHKLRSTFGTNLYNETGDIYLVADLLGHKDVNTTRRHYAAMDDRRRRQASRNIRLREPSSEPAAPAREVQEDQRPLCDPAREDKGDPN